MNPFFSKVSNISYVLDLGTSLMFDNSPAVLTPRDNNAVQTLTSYKLRSNIFLSLLKNSSFTIILSTTSLWNFD